MVIDDMLLTIGAMALELGVPAACIALFRSRPATRPRVVVVLGAAAPWLLFYGSVLVGLALGPASGARWAAAAMWAMSFIPYAVWVGAGIAASFAPRPRHLALRFLAGVVPPVGLVMLLAGA